MLSIREPKIEKKIPDTTSFTTTPEFNRLTKLSFDVSMKEAVKSLASKSQVDTALDTANKNSKKKNFKGLI